MHWNQIALASLPEDVTVLDTAMLFATLNAALWDGRIAYFTVKYRDLTWRPITAIRSALQADCDPLPAAFCHWYRLSCSTMMPGAAAPASLACQTASPVMNMLLPAASMPAIDCGPCAKLGPMHNH